jgi:RNA polymerase sigma-70 factor (ECF subfamily)
LAGPDSDAHLIEQLLAGDTDAFVALCDRHRDRVWRIAASVVTAVEADDLAQEAILRAFGARRTYSGEAPFAAWLCRIALNVARDYRRSAWRRRVCLVSELPAPEEAVDEAPHGIAERRELQRRVRQAVAALPERQRTPIWLHYFEGFSLAEIARLERAPEATLRSRVRAGLRRLSLALEDLLPPSAEATLSREPQRQGCPP